MIKYVFYIHTYVHLYTKGFSAANQYEPC